MSRNYPQIHIRLEPSVMEFLRRCARHQERTVGAHISFLLRREMDKEETEEAQPGSTPSSVSE
ncbi:hypothetical protein GRO01_15220 [Gluconobacter roseus NBRC 3990]|uniref:Arc-like DNA binding domain-containing protein n=1 Tax=Gluconobacter roseus NBRC 3990 TaxID=1307950 RepID=A0A4Y3M7S3_9PROT|nr:hypothetical protein GRO01_15220 [Gluconobacter roseus NBRC 3990]